MSTHAVTIYRKYINTEGVDTLVGMRAVWTL